MAVTSGAGGGYNAFHRYSVIVDAAYKAGFRGSNLITAVAIALAESRGNPNAHKNDAIEDSRGLWQININPRRSWGNARAAKYGRNRLFDPYVNARAAFDISKRGKTFQPWSTYTQSKNSYKNWLDEARDAVARTPLRRGAIDGLDRYSLNVAGGAGGSSSGGMLRQGDEGSGVTRLQQALAQAGFSPGPIDGKFGPKTASAVRSFQRARGLQVDGIVGPNTSGALYGGGSRQTGSVGDPGWVFPVQGGKWSDTWGADRDGGKRSHKGQDIFAPKGTHVRSPVSGRVKTSMYGRQRLGGLRLWVEGDDGHDYYFAHLSKLTARPGQRVVAGQTVGEVGNTGNASATQPHLHFGVRRRGSSSWINPASFLDGAGQIAGAGDNDPRPAGVGTSGIVDSPAEAASGYDGTQGDFVDAQYGESAEQLAYRIYGAAAEYFLQHPELGPILRDAAAGGWDAGRLQGAVSQTNWWRKSNQAARAWEALQVTDPGQAEAQLHDWAQRIIREGQRIGVTIGRSRARQLAETAIRHSWDQVDLTRILAAEMQWDSSSDLGDLRGTIAIEAARLKNAAQQWGVPVSDDWLQNNARHVVTGVKQFGDLELYLQRAAASRFPHLKEGVIDKGITIRDYMEPYIQSTAQLMERNPAEYGLEDRLIKRMIDFVDDDGNRRSMSLAEAEDYVRSTDGWKRTDNAQATYAEAAQGVARFFGATT